VGEVQNHVRGQLPSPRTSGWSEKVFKERSVYQDPSSKFLEYIHSIKKHTLSIEKKIINGSQIYYIMPSWRKVCSLYCHEKKRLNTKTVPQQFS